MARGEREEAGGRTEGSSSSMSSFWTIFMHADTVDRFLMTVGFIGTVGDGVSLPVMFYLTSRLLNDLGSGPSSLSDFSGSINKVTCFSFSSLIFRLSLIC